MKLNLFGDSSLLAAREILTPHLRQIQAPRDGQTCTPGAYRQTDCRLAVILLADLAAVLPSDTYGMFTLLGETRIVHNPRHHRAEFLHGGQYLPPHLCQHLFVIPGRVRHKVMQRLVHATNVIRSQTRGHRLDTFALSRQ